MRATRSRFGRPSTPEPSPCRHTMSPDTRSKRQITRGTLRGRPLSRTTTWLNHAASAGQSTPGSIGLASPPATYSPMSRKLRWYHEVAGSMYGTKISEMWPWYSTWRGRSPSR
jgi:hypothetical protein